MSARASAARWRRPRLSRAGDSPAATPRPAASSASRAASSRSRDAVEPGGERQVLEQGEVVVEQRLMGEKPDGAAERRIVRGAAAPGP